MLLALALAIVLSGCDGEATAPADTPTRAGTGVTASTAPEAATRTEAETAGSTGTERAAATDASGPLTVEDYAWLGGVEGVVETLVGDQSMSSDELIIETSDEIRAEAQRLRRCSEELDRLGSPSERVRSVYDLAVHACDAFAAAADCAETMAEYPTVMDADDPRVPKVSEAADCWVARANDGADLLIAAQEEGLRLRFDVGDD